MNTRQIRLLNKLEQESEFLKEEVKTMMNMIVLLTEKMKLLENPPKRPRGRPRKNA